MLNFNKPNLASDAVDLYQAKYPLYATFKVDGVRALIQNGRVLSRTGKEFPNPRVQAAFGLPELEGFDGELTVGELGPDTFTNTTSSVMSFDGICENMKLHVFDIHDSPDIFEIRRKKISERLGLLGSSENVSIVPGMICHTPRIIFNILDSAVGMGYEGLVLRNPEGVYKHGRSTMKSQDFMRLVIWETSEAEILSVIPGKTHGAIKVKDVTTGAIFNLSCHSDMSGAVGKNVVYKFRRTVGDLPRFPILKGLRDERDM